MLDSISNTRLAAVHPELARRIQQLASMLSFDIRVTQALRTYAEQNEIYAQGRTAPGLRVTDAPGGYSQHNFGVAVDVVPITGGVVDWNGKDAKWAELLTKAPTCGLAEGALWHHPADEPHLYPQEVPAEPTDQMRQAFELGGLHLVWNLFNLASHETFGSA